MRLAFVTCALWVSLAACGDNFEEGTGSGAGGGEPACPHDPNVASCHEDPWLCNNQGQTCWLTTDATGFQCINPAVGSAAGAQCDYFAGTATCDVGLYCLQLQGEATGTCRPWCDNAELCKACPEGLVCGNVREPNTMALLSICVPPP